MIRIVKEEVDIIEISLCYSNVWIKVVMNKHRAWVKLVNSIKLSQGLDIDFV